MFLVAVVVIALLTVPLARGRLSLLADVQLRCKPAIFAALALQIVIVSVVPAGAPLVHRALHLASYALAAVFLIANRRIAGAKIIAWGAALNVFVIAVNEGVMPASASALRAAGEPISSSDFANSTHLAHARFQFLGDIFAIPRPVPLHNVFSIGDVCIAIGVALAIHSLTDSRIAHRSLPRQGTALDHEHPAPRATI